MLGAVLAFASSASAQSNYYSYYDTRDAAQRQLRTVEQYHLGKAIANIDGGAWALAISECDFILRYFPDHPRALYMLATAAQKTGDLDQAQAYFDRAIELYPKSATTYAVYGLFKYQLGDLEDAVAAYKKGIELVPDYAEAHYNLGLVYAALDDYASANIHAQVAYRLGYPLPGLRNVLQRVNAWSPLTEQEIALAFRTD